jgi:hypothetical protein
MSDGPGMAVAAVLGQRRDVLDLTDSVAAEQPAHRHQGLAVGHGEPAVRDDRSGARLEVQQLVDERRVPVRLARAPWHRQVLAAVRAGLFEAQLAHHDRP